jgi:hypothetical protein
MDAAKWWILAWAISFATGYFIASAVELIVVLELINGRR